MILRMTGLIGCFFVSAMSSLAAAAGLPYPPAPRQSVVDTYFGTQVTDPYRWLENIDSPQTTAWVQAESALTRNFLDAIPRRARSRIV